MDCHEKAKERSAIIRNNRHYLLANIHPNDELIDLMLSLNCLTYAQCHFIQRQRLNRDKNSELLNVIRSCDETTFCNFVKCLRQTHQMAAARIVEKGGVAIKVKVHNQGAKCTLSRELLQFVFHQNIEDILNKTKPRSRQADKVINQLIEEDMEFLNSQLDRRAVVVWIWCRSQSALQHIQNMYESVESNQLRDVFFGLANVPPPVDGTWTSEIIQSKLINVDSNQFKKTVVVRTTSVNFTQRINLGRSEVYGVTKLRNEIYILCQSFPNVICVHEDRNLFLQRKTIKIREIRSPSDIGSSEMDSCLYVSDSSKKCSWRVTSKTDDQDEVTKWVTIDNHQFSMSASSDGQLLVIIESSSILMIYGSDAELVRSIQLPRDIHDPIHAVVTSNGNFVILYRWMIEKKGGNYKSNWGEWEVKWGVCELTRDGQTVVRRSIPSNKTQRLNDPRYLTIDSDDQVFVADYGNGRVVLLDFDLKWSEIIIFILCPTKEDEEEEEVVETTRRPGRMYYDDEMRQLIVGEYLENGTNIYTLV